MSTPRSWAAVHATRPAAALLTVVAVVSLAFAQEGVSGFGPIRFLAPISASLMIPTLAGVAVGIACDNRARLPLPRPGRTVAARLSWSLAWTSLATLAVSCGQLPGAAVALAPVVRNLLIHASLSLLVLTAGVVALVWLPAVMLTLTSMLFGQRGTFEFYWWAVTLQDRTTAAQWAATLGLFVVALASFSCLGGRVSRWAPADQS